MLVNSPRFPDRHNILPHWNLFAPRLGIAYRLTDKTAIRTGFAISYSPGDIEQNASPTPLPSIPRSRRGSLPRMAAGPPVNLLNNPYPNGVPLPVGHNDAYESIILGTQIVTPLPQGDPASYVENWNFGVSRQISNSASFDVAYVGLRGLHLPMGGGVTVNGLGFNQIPTPRFRWVRS